MQREVGWHHPVDEADQWDGFNDSGIETFSGSPIVNLAREIIQNALDAKATLPVKVDFSLQSRPVKDIPNLESLKSTIKACSESAEHEGNKAKAFLRRASELLRSHEIEVLEISDANTTGVIGPCKKGTPFYAFLKAKGQSNKPTRTSSGSYGIGKFAPYAVSSLRTVFVSTVYKDAAKSIHQLTQGKSILMSHDASGERRQATGFWGKTNRCQPVEGIPSIAKWLLRSRDEDKLKSTDIGTKICILGFSREKTWDALLAISVAVNFFAALVRGELEVRINDSILVDKNSVKEILNADTNVETIRGSSIKRDAVENCKSYLDALVSEDAVESCSEMRDLGLTQLRLKVEDGLPRRVAIIRNGMFITDRLDGLKRFAGFKEFSGVLECRNDSGNELLRSIEPPRHDDFEPERAATPEDKVRARRALDELTRWVRDMLDRHAKDEVAEVTSVNELAEYFADDQQMAASDSGEEADPLGNVVFSPKPIKRSATRSKQQQEKVTGGKEEGGQDGGGGDDGAGGGNGRGGLGDGSGGQSSEISQGPSVGVRDVRALGGRSRYRKVAFTPERSAAVRLSAFVAGADSDEPLSIVSATRGSVSNGRVRFDAEGGKREVFELEFDRGFDGAMRIVLHEV